MKIVHRVGRYGRGQVVGELVLGDVECTIAVEPDKEVRFQS